MRTKGHEGAAMEVDESQGAHGVSLNKIFSRQGTGGELSVIIRHFKCQKQKGGGGAVSQMPNVFPTEQPAFSLPLACPAFPMCLLSALQMVSHCCPPLPLLSHSIPCSSLPFFIASLLPCPVLHPGLRLFAKPSSSLILLHQCHPLSIA